MTPSSPLLVLLLWCCITATTSAKTIVPIDLYGLNYNTRQGPDWAPDEERCKDEATIRADLTVLKQVTNRIRLLSCVDCNQGPMVVPIARELGMQLWLGLWVSTDPTVFDNELALLEQMIGDGLLSEEGDVVGESNTILGVTVGSEAVYREEVTAAESAAYKNQTKARLTELGYGDLPVAICDVDDTYEANPSTMVKATDVVMANSFPFWENIDVEGAVDYFVARKWADVVGLAGVFDKEVIIGETGWASEGSHEDASDATGENQATYLRDFYCEVDVERDWSYFYFTGIDNSWRHEQDLSEDVVEGHFGIFYSNRTLKAHFATLEFTCPGDDDTIYRFVTDQNDNFPTQTPTTVAEGAVLSASCSAHPECAQRNLNGDCCPAPGGGNLGCCEEQIDPLEEPPTTAPTSFPATVPNATTTTTEAPSSAPIVVTTDDAQPTSRPTMPIPPLEGNDTPTASPFAAMVDSAPSPSPTVSLDDLTNAEPVLVTFVPMPASSTRRSDVGRFLPLAGLVAFVFGMV